MKIHNYLFRISCLELFYPIIINEDICILPNSDNIRNDIETSSTHIDFNPKSYSYLLIKSEDPIDREDLKIQAKEIISMLTILLLNPLYIEEFYYFKFGNGSTSLVEAEIQSFEEPNFQKNKNYLHGRLGIHSFNQIVKRLFKQIKQNPISDSLYSIMMEYIASHRISLIEVSGTMAWNVLEHMASRYWKSKDPKKLYILTEQKLNDFLDDLGDFVDNYEINKEEDVTLDHPDYKNNYRSLLKRTITSDIIRFSPVKFRIYRMFEEEKIEYKSYKHLIKDMYDIRIKIYHYGLSLDEIKSEIGKDPIDIIIKFRAFLYPKILEFAGFIDEFFFFDSGHLIKKDGTSVNQNIMDLEINIPNNLEEFEFVQEIKSLDNLLHKLIGKNLDLKVIEEDRHYNVSATLSKHNDEYIITFLDDTQVFFSVFSNIRSKNDKYPDQIMRYLRPIKSTFIYENFRYKIEFYYEPIEPYIFKLRFSHPKIEKWIETQTGKKTANNYETDTVSFKINKINISKI